MTTKQDCKMFVNKFLLSVLVVLFLFVVFFVKVEFFYFVVTHHVYFQTKINKNFCSCNGTSESALIRRVNCNFVCGRLSYQHGRLCHLCLLQFFIVIDNRLIRWRFYRSTHAQCLKKQLFAVQTKVAKKVLVSYKALNCLHWKKSETNVNSGVFATTSMTYSFFYLSFQFI